MESESGHGFPVQVVDHSSEFAVSLQFSAFNGQAKLMEARRQETEDPAGFGPVALQKEIPWSTKMDFVKPLIEPDGKQHG